MHYKLASIIFNPPNQNQDKTADIFIAQVDSGQENLLGKVFMQLELNIKKNEALKIIEHLINTFLDNYYNNEKIILREKMQNLKIEHIFELALSKTNEALKIFLDKEKIKLHSQNLNAVIGVIHDEGIHFSICGKAKALLFYKEKNLQDNLKKIENNKEEERKINYKMIDITGKNENNSNSSPENKLFASIINGQIPKFGYFMFVNEALPEYVSNQQLLNIVTKLPPFGASEQIKNLLGKINAHVPFLGIIIKNTEHVSNLILENNKTKNQVITDIEQPSSDLHNTETETEKIMTPSGIAGFKKWFGLKTDNKISSDKNNFFKDKIFIHKKSLASLAKNILIALFNLLLILINLLIKIIKTILKPSSWALIFKKSKQFLGKTITFFKLLTKNILSLKNSHKFLLLIVLILPIALFYNLKSKKEENIEQNIISKVDIAIEEIKQLENQIEASFLYNNEEKSKEMLEKMKEKLEILKNAGADIVEQNKNFFENYEEQMEKIRKITKPEINELIDFGNLNNQANAENIILSGAKIFGGDNQQKTIYLFDTNNKTSTAITDINNSFGDLSLTMTDNDNNVYYFNNNNVTKLNNQANEINNLTINLPDEAKITAIAGYNNRLYLLDEAQGQIYRYNPVGSGFGGKTNWINTEIDLSGAVSFYIDGGIWILKNNGDVIKLFGGEKENFQLAKIDPILEKSKKIIAPVDSSYLYILDSSQKRIVVFNKSGLFLQQYSFKNLNNLKDFIILEKEKKSYILSNNKIYEFSLDHF